MAKKQYTYELYGILRKIEAKIDRLASHLGVEFIEVPIKKGRDDLDLFPSVKEILRRVKKSQDRSKG